ncbi:hypothetical protein ATCC27039_16490 [Actinomyces naeslundii]|nr:hypothetical protein ATCC27039_16490 [Actinomyces naeslundii]
MGVDDVAALSEGCQLPPGREQLVRPGQRHGQTHDGQTHDSIVPYAVIDGGRGEMDDANVVAGGRHGGGVACHEDPETR